MGQSVANLNSKVNSLNDLIQERGNGLVQQCLSTPHFLCFQTRFKGKTLYFYLGRGAQYQGFDFSEVKPPANLRIQDKFLQYARKYWRGLQIGRVVASTEERCLLFQGYAQKAPVKVWFFWRGRDLFFSHAEIRDNKVYFFKSWIGKCTLIANHFESLSAKEVFEDVGFGTLEGLGERKGDISVASYLNQFKFREAKEESSVESKSKRSRTIGKIKSDLKKFEILKFLEAQTEKDLTDVKKIGEGRFSVRFSGLEGHYKKREFLYDKIKGWKRSQRFLENRLHELSDGPEKKGLKKTQKPSFGKTIQPIWKENKTKQTITKTSNYIELEYNGVKVFLGRTALENDFIRKNLAKKEDLWLHLDGHKSGHMFVKNQSGSLGLEDIQILASAMVELNGISLQEIPVIYTQVRNLKGVKGTPGMVNYKKEKHIVVYFDQEWRQKLTSIEVTEDG